MRAPAAGGFEAHEDDGGLSVWLPEVGWGSFAPDDGAEVLAPSGGDVAAGSPLLRISSSAALSNFLGRAFNAIADKELEARAQAQAERLAGPFLAGLDPAALEASRTDLGIRVDLYNHLAAGGDAEISKRRVQAARAVGALRELLPDLDAAKEAIDAGRPLLPALSEDVRGLDKISLRLLSKTDPAILRAAGVSPRDAVAALSAVRPDHHPDRGEGPSGARWSALLRTWRCISDLASECRLDPKPLMAIEAPVWLKGEVRDPVDRIATRDAVLGFHRHVLVPLAIDALARTGARPGDSGFPFLVSGALGERGWRGTEILQSALLRGRTVSRMQELAKRWHAEGAAIGAVVAQKPQEEAGSASLSWEPISPPWRSPSGILVAPLVCDKDLAAESDAMDHCVGRGGYLPKCLYESTHILSLRDAAGARLSTVEVDMGDGSPRVIQHRGPSNAEPCAEAKGALRDWLSACGKDIPVDPGALSAAQDRRREQRGEHAVVELVGYDISKPRLREAMFQAYSFMLPRGERGMPLARWVEEKGIGKAVAENIREDAAVRVKESAERKARLGAHVLPMEAAQ